MGGDLSPERVLEEIMHRGQNCPRGKVCYIPLREATVIKTNKNKNRALE